MGKFAVKTVKSGIKFNLKAGNGEIIAVSEGYKAKASCMNGIESVRKNAPRPRWWKRKADKTCLGYKLALKTDTRSPNRAWWTGRPLWGERGLLFYGQGLCQYSRINSRNTGRLRWIIS